MRNMDFAEISIQVMWRFGEFTVFVDDDNAVLRLDEELVNDILDAIRDELEEHLAPQDD